MTSLVDFIIESAATHFTLLKFVLLHRVESAKIDELIEFIEDQNKEVKETYTGFIEPIFSFSKEIKRQNDELSSSFKRMREEFERTIEEMKHANEKKENQI